MGRGPEICVMIEELINFFYKYRNIPNQPLKKLISIFSNLVKKYNDK